VAGLQIGDGNSVLIVITGATSVLFVQFSVSTFVLVADPLQLGGVCVRDTALDLNSIVNVTRFSAFIATYIAAVLRVASAANLLHRFI
jgi:hypothetical protein